MDIEKSETAWSEWRKGWPTAFSAMLGTLFATSFLYSLGVFIEPLETEFGWRRSDISLGVTLLGLIGAFTHGLAGTLVDRFGARRVALVSTTFYSLSLLIVPLASDEVWSWWVVTGILGLAFGSMSTVVWMSGAISHFNKSRGIAVATVQLGPALALTLLPVIVSGLIAQFGWRMTYIIMSGAGFAVVFPATYFGFFDKRTLRTSQASKGRSNLSRILLSSQYIRMALATFLAVTSLTALNIHFVPMLTDSGVHRVSAAWIAGMIGIGSLSGRVIFGLLLDRLPSTLVAGAAFIIPIFGCVLLLGTDLSYFFLAIAAFIIGLSLGAEVDVIAYLTSRLFGLAHYGTVFGFLVMCMSLGAGFGPWIAGLSFDETGSYRTAQIGGMFMLGLATILILSVTPTLRSSTVRQEDSPEMNA